MYIVGSFCWCDMHGTIYLEEGSNKLINSVERKACRVILISWASHKRPARPLYNSEDVPANTVGFIITRSYATASLLDTVSRDSNELFCTLVI